MAIRVAELDAVLDELRGRLVGAPLQAVRVPRADRVVLTLRVPGETVHLLIVVQSPHARLHLIERPPANPAVSLTSQGRLRALLHGRCGPMGRMGGDRVVELALGDHRLIIELTGRHGNLFVVDADGRIAASLLPNRSHRRDLQPGQPYQPPASTPPPPRPPRFEPPEVGPQLAAFYGVREGMEELETRRGAAMRQLRTLRKRLARKADRQLEEASREGRIAELRREADLLNAHFHELTRGRTSVELPDLFEAGTPARRITLEPALAPREQVERRYRQARRLERGMTRAADEYERTSQELAEVVAAASLLETAADLATLEARIEELPARWRPQAGPRRVRRGERLPYREFRTATGQLIRVGRAATDNDALTFRFSRGRDVWLHVVGRPGAHVVIPLDRGAVPDPATLEVAAQLALAHSGFGEGDDGEVAWTRVKYVRKPKGAPPGAVLHTQERVLYLRRTRAALDGLTAT